MRFQKLNKKYQTPKKETRIQCMVFLLPSNKGKKWFNDGKKNFYLNPNDPSTKLYNPGLFPNNKRKGRIPWNKKI